MYRSRHTVHLYLALVALAFSGASAGLNVWAYYDEGQVATRIGFAASVITGSVLFFTWFWGTFLVFSGTVPRGRLGFLMTHAVVGSAAPSLYALYTGWQMETDVSQPISGWGTVLAISGAVVVTLQVVSGSSVLNRRIWYWLRHRRCA